MGVTRKQSTPNFPKNEHFLPPDTHTNVYEMFVFLKFGALCFFVTPFCLITVALSSMDNRGDCDYERKTIDCEGKTILKIFTTFPFFFRRLENKYALGNMKYFMNNFFALRNHHNIYNHEIYCSEITKS